MGLAVRGQVHDDVRGLAGIQAHWTWTYAGHYIKCSPWIFFSVQHQCSILDCRYSNKTRHTSDCNCRGCPWQLHCKFYHGDCYLDHWLFSQLFFFAALCWETNRDSVSLLLNLTHLVQDTVEEHNDWTRAPNGADSSHGVASAEDQTSAFKVRQSSLVILRTSFPAHDLNYSFSFMIMRFLLVDIGCLLGTLH